MTPNCLYMFEFSVNDVKITKHNRCAPEEYPLCIEFSFRSYVKFCVWENEIRKEISSENKVHRCCLFALDSPVTDEDIIDIQVYKKRTEKCKFLVGKTQTEVKNLFDIVTDKYNENPKGAIRSAKATINLPRKSGQKSPQLSLPVKDSHISHNTMDEMQSSHSIKSHHEESLETHSETINLPRESGPKLPQLTLSVKDSHTSHNTMDEMQSSHSSKSHHEESLETHSMTINLPRESGPKSPQLSLSVKDSHMSHNTIDEMQSSHSSKSHHEECVSSSSSKSSVNEEKTPVSELVKLILPMKDEKGRVTGHITLIIRLTCMGNVVVSPCPPEEQQVNTTNVISQEEEEAVKYESSEESVFLGQSTYEESNEQTAQETEEHHVLSTTKIYPKEISSSQTKTSFDEYEANFNYNSILVRLPKDSHRMKRVTDAKRSIDSHCDCSSCESFNQSDSSKGVDVPDRRKQKRVNQCEVCDLFSLLQDQRFVKNFIKRYTGGRINNEDGLPIVRGNVKYPDTDQNNIEKYKRVPPKVRNCCMQVNDRDIDDNIQGFQPKKLKTVEISRESPEDPETDVFIIKLGKKRHENRKRNFIEIKMKTPKAPDDTIPSKVSRETQVQNSLLDLHKLVVPEEKVVVQETPVSKEKPKLKKKKKKGSNKQ